MNWMVGIVDDGRCQLKAESHVDAFDGREACAYGGQGFACAHVL